MLENLIQNHLKKQLPLLSPIRYTLCITYVDNEHRRVSSPDFGICFVTSPRWLPLTVEQVEKDIEQKLKEIHAKEKAVPTPLNWREIIDRSFDDRTVTAKETSKILRLSEATVWRLCNSGELICESTQNGYRRILHSSVKKYLERKNAMNGLMQRRVRKPTEYPLFIVHENNHRYIHSPDFKIIITFDKDKDPYAALNDALARIYRQMALAIQESEARGITNLKIEKELTTSQAAAFLGISVSTLKRLHECGKISAYTTPAGHRRFTVSSLEQYKGQSEASL